jgi:hypothetical protein
MLELRKPPGCSDPGFRLCAYERTHNGPDLRFERHPAIHADARPDRRPDGKPGADVDGRADRHAGTHDDAQYGADDGRLPIHDYGVLTAQRK